MSRRPTPVGLTHRIEMMTVGYMFAGQSKYKLLLSTRFDPKQWDVISPDKSYTTETPILLAEVLSPSREATDLGDRSPSIWSFQASSLYSTFISMPSNAVGCHGMADAGT
jgi:hypothetical protein